MPSRTLTSPACSCPACPAMPCRCGKLHAPSGPVLPRQPRRALPKRASPGEASPNPAMPASPRRAHPREAMRLLAHPLRACPATSYQRTPHPDPPCLARLAPVKDEGFTNEGMQISQMTLPASPSAGQSPPCRDSSRHCKPRHACLAVLDPPSLTTPTPATPRQCPPCLCLACPAGPSPARPCRAKPERS